MQQPNQTSPPSPIPENELLAFLMASTAEKCGLLAPRGESFFRYISVENETAWQKFEQTVLHNQLPLTDPARLNDPFDLKPLLVNDLNTAEIEILSGPDAGVHKSREKPDVLAAIEQKVASIMNNHFDVQYANRRIASFSKRLSSQLLWAHYTNGYRGIAYHFVRGTHNSIFTQMRSVSYGYQRPLIPWSLVLGLAQANKNPIAAELLARALNFSDRCFLHKSVEWRHEEEARIVASKDENSEFHEAELATIVVGPRCPSEHIDRMKKIISSRRRTLKLVPAYLSRTEYFVEVQWDKEL